MTRPRISRRTMLRGAGAALALPFLESLGPIGALAGAAAGKPPVRLGIFTVTGGTVLESWQLPTAGPLAAAKLPSILRSLEPFKDDLTLISGLAHGGRSDNVNGHEHCAFMHLTGAETVARRAGKPVAGVSVDQAAAAALGDRTLLPSLEIGLGSHETQFSFRAPDAPVPFEANPRLVFERMFRGRAPVVPNWRRRAGEAEAAPASGPADDSLDRSVLDVVLEQARDLRRGLGRSDGRKLDEYLDSVRSVERRIAFLEARHRRDLLDLAEPGPSPLALPGNLPKPGLPIWEITRPIYQDTEKHGEYIRLLAELMVLAFQTDTTRVATVAAGSDESMFPGVVTVGYERHCHTLEHQGNAGRVEDADPIAREALRQIHAWYTRLFAEMIARLKGIDEGGSSLLDNSLILYTSYMANGGHGTEDYPVLLAGRAGGALKSGRQLDFPSKAPMANLYVETLNLLGIPTERFGDSHTSRHAGTLAGRLPGLT